MHRCFNKNESVLRNPESLFSFSFKVTSLMGMPLKFQRIVKEMKQKKIRLNSVKSVHTAGGILTRTLAQDILSAFELDSLRNIYGISEASGIVCVAPQNTTNYKTIGFSIPMVQLQVIAVELFTDSPHELVS